MAYPVTHIIVPMLIVETYRRYFAKRKFSRWYVFLAGFLGAAPDFDFIYSWLVTGSFELAYHRNVTHTLFVPMILLLLGAAIYLLRYKRIVRSSCWRAAYNVLFMGTIGIAMHIFVDAFDGMYQWFYPLTLEIYLPNLILNEVRASMIDGTLMLIWLLYDEEMLDDILRFLRLKKKR